MIDLDDLRAMIRFNGPPSGFTAVLAAIGATGDATPVALAAIDAAETAQRDVAGFTEWRKRARSETQAQIDAIDALQAARHEGMGSIRTGMLLDRLAIPSPTGGRMDLFGEALAVERERLAAQAAALSRRGKPPTLPGTLAKALVPVFEKAVGRKATVSSHQYGGSGGGDFPDFVQAACALVGEPIDKRRAFTSAKVALAGSGIY
jgi:hypothetical protein